MLEAAFLSHLASTRRLSTLSPQAPVCFETHQVLGNLWVLSKERRAFMPN